MPENHGGMSFFGTLCRDYFYLLMLYSKEQNSCGLVANVLDSPSSSGFSFTISYMTHWWRHEGHLDEIAPYIRKVPLHTRAHPSSRNADEHVVKVKMPGWLHSIVVRTLVSAGKISLSCARLLAG